jgi:hypothetical protein
MTAAAEGISFLARRIVVYRSQNDMEAQRRNADIVRQIAFHAAQAERHPDQKIRDESALKAWKLMKKIGGGDSQLGSGLITVQRERLTEGADTALQSMLTGVREPAPAHTPPLAIEPGEPTPEAPTEPVGSSVILSQHRDSSSPALRDNRPIIQPPEQVIRREPVLSPAEMVFAKTTQTAGETSPETDSARSAQTDQGSDEKEQQITTLAHRLKTGERLTKTTAAQLLGVSPATAGRRLKDARDRIGEGTGFYA